MKKVVMNGQTWLADDDFPMDLIEHQNELHREHRSAALFALPAMDRLAEVLRGRSGQPYKLRGLLYSLWNGKPFSLVEVVCLDREIRKDLCSVLLGFGHGKFFYEQLEAAVRKVGQWDWFLEEDKNIEDLEAFVKSRRAS